MAAIFLFVAAIGILDQTAPLCPASAELRVVQQASRLPVPEFPVLSARIWTQPVGLLGIQLHHEAMRREIVVHPRNHIAFLDVDRMLVLVVVEDVF